MLRRLLLPKQAIILLVTGAWAIAVVGGLALLLEYEAMPGPGGLPAPFREAMSDSVLNVKGNSLLVFLHPQCPCSRATVEELAVIMTRCQGKVQARAFFYRPAAAEREWVETDTWEAAGRIPGVEVKPDPEGREAARFAAKTSGHTLLYDCDGRLLFAGGITLGRGHLGSNPGRDSIIALVTNQGAAVKSTNVFGCPISE